MRTLYLSYAVMALPDAVGVLSAKLGVADVSSLLFFLWFAVLPVPVGVLCVRLGASRLVRAALLLSGAVCFLLAGGSRPVALAGLAVAGFANVLLQVAVPVQATEAVPADRLASVLTGGLFVKTLMAMAFPSLVAWASSCSLALLPFAWANARDAWFLALVPFAALAAWGAASVGVAPRPAVASAEAVRTLLRATRRVLADPVSCGAVVAFAVALVMDVAYNLSVPETLSRRFGAGDAAVAVVYATLFGVKLPVTLFGAWLFRRRDARRTFALSSAVALAGALVLFAAGSLPLYLVGVALFATGCANVYGHVFGTVARRHPAEASAAASLLVTALAAGAVASPLLDAARRLGVCAAEGVVLALGAALLPLAVFVSFSRRCP